MRQIHPAAPSRPQASDVDTMVKPRFAGRGPSGESFVITGSQGRRTDPTTAKQGDLLAQLGRFRERHLTTARAMVMGSMFDEFTEDGALDLASQKRCVDFMIDAGSQGLCILATFSEQVSLSDDGTRAYLEWRGFVPHALLPHVMNPRRHELPDVQLAAAGDYFFTAEVPRAACEEAKGFAVLLTKRLWNSMRTGASSIDSRISSAAPMTRRTRPP